MSDGRCAVLIMALLILLGTTLGVIGVARRDDLIIVAGAFLCGCCSGVAIGAMMAEAGVSL